VAQATNSHQHRAQELYHYMNIKIQMQFIASLPYD